MNNINEEFSKIYDRYIDKIYRFVFLKVNSQEIAEDLTSETFSRGWEKFKEDQKEIKNIQAFLYQIARNLVTDHYREKGRTQFVSIDNVSIADPRLNLEKTSQTRSDLEIVKSGLSRINDDYRDIVIWHYLDDLSIPEISKITGKSEEAVRVMVHRALKALKNELES